jgi:putative NADH-flavin reductase
VARPGKRALPWRGAGWHFGVMKLGIVGATGKTGRSLIAQALPLGHELRALARDPGALAVRHPNLEILGGDIRDPAVADALVDGVGAVLSALGARDKGEATIFSSGTKSLVEAMRRRGVRRLIVLSSFGVGDSRRDAGLLFGRLLVPLFLGEVYEDKERQEELVRRSGLDFTIVRATRLTDGVATYSYRVGERVPFSLRAGAVSRHDVAHFMLRQLEDTRYLGRAVSITGSATTRRSAAGYPGEKGGRSGDGGRQRRRRAPADLAALYLPRRRGSARRAALPGPAPGDRRGAALARRAAALDAGPGAGARRL